MVQPTTRSLCSVHALIVGIRNRRDSNRFIGLQYFKLVISTMTLRVEVKSTCVALKYTAET